MTLLFFNYNDIVKLRLLYIVVKTKNGSVTCASRGYVLVFFFSQRLSVDYTNFLKGSVTLSRLCNSRVFATVYRAI